MLLISVVVGCIGSSQLNKKTKRFNGINNDYFCFFIFSHSTFDVGRSMFDVHFSFSNPSTVPRRNNKLALMRARLALVHPMNLMIRRAGLCVDRESVGGYPNVATLGFIGGARYSLQIEGSWHWTFAFAALLPVLLRTCLLQKFSAL